MTINRTKDRNSKHMIDLHQESKIMIMTMSMKMRRMMSSNHLIVEVEEATTEEAAVVEAAEVDRPVEEVFIIKKDKV